jgi:hypothetical protein
MRGEISAPTMRTAWQKQPAEPAWRQVSGILWSPDLILVLAVSALGLFASVCAALFFSSFLDIVAP